MTAHGATERGLAAAGAPGASTPDRWRRLARVSRAVTGATSADSILELVAHEAAALLGVAKAVVMLADDDGLLQVRAAHGIDARLVEQFRAPLDETLIGRLHGLFDAPDAVGFLGVPLVVRGQVIGLLGVLGRSDTSDTSGAPWADEDEELLSALADQTAAPIEVARLDAELRRGLQLAKERALATLAHDLRSPLQAIEGFAALVDQEVLGPVTSEQRGALRRIRMSGRHLLALQEDMLDAARVGARTSRTSGSGGAAADATDGHGPRWTDLRAVVHEAAAIVRADIEARGHTLTVDVPGDAAVGPADAGSGDAVPTPTEDAAALRVLANSDRLRRVLINLLSNAAKYTRAGGAVTIRSGVIAEADARRWGTVTVTDTGIGISPAHLEAIFEPYYRVADRETTGVPGAGLGLAICRELVEEMGGQIAVESEPGVGSAFTIRFPLAA